MQKAPLAVYGASHTPQFTPKCASQEKTRFAEKEKALIGLFLFQRPKALPLESAAFEKAGETFRIIRRIAVALRPEQKAGETFDT
ncbi:MAG: hypothetical protein HFG20_08450 [Anaerotruncus sp.]|nr:hypothetical protein [Anaerotruncus sp.]